MAAKRRSTRSELDGPEGFWRWYAEVWGDRWPSLAEALTAPVRHVAWLNPFAAQPGEGLPPEARPVPELPGCVAGDGPLPPPPEREPVPYYLLDPASVVAARALDVREGDRVLDLCAAPGGKAVQLAAALGGAGTLVANDRSAARRARLHRVLDGHLPAGVRARVRVTGHDAARWALHERDAYDRVLLDAPCSSERHVVNDPRALAEWTPARTRQLARRQYAMLAAALDAARPGGRIVYATCSISPWENDAVVARLLDRRAGRVRVVSGEGPGEAAEHGTWLLPDRTGWGPIYYAVLERA